MSKSKGPKLPRLRLPAMNCKMGDRGYLVTAMRFSEISQRVLGNVRLIHKSAKLADWIQRQLVAAHAKRIANYLKSEPSRFFNALVVGVYGGDPQWSELSVADPADELTEDEQQRVNATIGVLILTGKETLFPIDGQHRVVGIKQAVEDDPELGEEEVTVIMVGHAKTDSGTQRTRRLFVTLNQRAKKVSNADIVALDEDNGVAVVTRRIIDEKELFPKEDLVLFSGSTNLPEAKPRPITSILGIYNILKVLYPKKRDYEPSYRTIIRSRPTDDELETVHDLATRYWKALISEVPEYKRVVETGTKNAGSFRSEKRNHLLFRPAGQMAMARATECLLSKGEKVEDAVSALVAGAEMDLLNVTWHSILWNRGTKKMMNEQAVAETVLLLAAKKAPRTEAARQRLKQVIDEREQ